MPSQGADHLRNQHEVDVRIAAVLVLDHFGIVLTVRERED